VLLLKELKALSTKVNREVIKMKSSKEKNQPNEN